MNENKEFKLEALVEPLCLWYEKEKRSMPWRDDATPYHVWLSEIMLQQTRIEAAKAYYDRFTKCLPDIPSLAEVLPPKLLPEKEYPVYKVSAGYSFSGSSFGGRTSEIVGRTWVL